MQTICGLHFAAGGNRHPSAADWAPGLLAFGAGKNVALWDPNNSTKTGIHALLAGHTDVVNVVKIYDSSDGRLIITGGADKTIRIWKQHGGHFEQTQCLTEHQGSINTISILPRSGTLTSGAADATLKIWKFSGAEAKLVSSITLKSRYIPLTTAMVELEDETLVLAVAGTSTVIHVYVSFDGSAFELQTTLSGHEGWIRSLDFGKPDGQSDILLASASQDKYIRLWRVSRSSNASTDGLLLSSQKSLSNKAHQLRSASNTYTVMFESLLIGHEDWIYTVKWEPQTDREKKSGTSRLVSASADNSLAIWEADQRSGVWICQTRLGDISSQKGSTSATGSTGGFWIGLWNAFGDEVVSLGRTGSWRRWKYDPSSDMWTQKVGISGHTQEVQDVVWASDGSYVISTGSDQTTRMFAEWKRHKDSSWHEFARPQIHGYDLNCIDSLGANRFISGADEKLLRVFDKPRAINDLLAKLSGIQSETNDLVADAANIPVLGLSNKAITATSDVGTKANGFTDQEIDTESGQNGPAQGTVGDLDHPPFEEHLARTTLWPEHEKLYGHGYEISAVAASHDGLLVATACKASTIDHAVIRIYETKEWHEIKPSLAAHNLTVTALAFSCDDAYLLSVGRDRQWTVYQRGSDDSQTLQKIASNPKGHSRMILDCSWAPSDGAKYVFATAGRDKAVRVWRSIAAGDFECVTAITANAAVTAVAFDTSFLRRSLRLAYAMEDGNVHIASLSAESLEIITDDPLPSRLVPSGAINALSWRPKHGLDSNEQSYLAIASDDASVRIIKVRP